MKSAMRWVTALGGAVAMMAAAASAAAQSGGSYEVTHHVIAGGGAGSVAGGNYGLGATVGQFDASVISGDPYVISGGFWNAAEGAPLVTPTRTVVGPTITGTRNATATPTPGGSTPTPNPNGSRSVTPKVTSTPTPRATATATIIRTPSSTPTRTHTPGGMPVTNCIGDCTNSRHVSVADLVLGVDIALASLDISFCPAFDGNTDNQVSVTELVQAVDNSLNGCPPEP